MKNCHHLFILALLALSLAIPQAGQAQGKMYWADPGTGKIQRANLDGSSVQDLVAGLDFPSDIALDVNAGKMYWTVENDGKIQRANLDGTGAQDLVTGITPPFPSTLALDLTAGKLYWAESGKIRRANLDGSGSEDVLTGLDVVDDLALDPGAGKMYWIESFDIRRANLDGTSFENLVTGLGNGHGIALDLPNGKMYWTDEDDSKIARANLDGTSVEDVITGLTDNPQGIALDVFEGKMYWTDEGTAQIHRANLDGSNIENLVSTLLNPEGIALDVAVSPSARFVSAVGQSFTMSRSKFSTSQGNIHSNSLLRFQKGDPTTYTGNLTAVGDVIIDKDNTIVGNVKAGGRIVLGKNSRIIGTATPGANVVALPPDPCDPPDPCEPPEPCNVFNIGKGQSLTLPPNEPPDPCYDVTLASNASLNLVSGEYIFARLVTNSESNLNFDVSNGAVVLNVCNNLSLGKEVTFNITPSGQANSQLVTIFALQSSQVSIAKESYVLGTINAPNATVNIGKNSSFRGAVCALQTTVDRDVIMLHHSSPGVLPKQILAEEEATSNEQPATSYQLEQNYPNPFWSAATSRVAGNPTTEIKYALPEAGLVRLQIYDMLGREVRMLVHARHGAGRYVVQWDGRNEAGESVAAGTYLYRLALQPESGEAEVILVKKMAMVK
jgi:cytoskeletal protein CcmA (bactofilin family)